MIDSATYLCAACGKVASTVTLAAPGEPDPRLTPEPVGYKNSIRQPADAVHD